MKALGLTVQISWLYFGSDPSKKMATLKITARRIKPNYGEDLLRRTLVAGAY